MNTYVLKLSHDDVWSEGLLFGQYHTNINALSDVYGCVHKSQLFTLVHSKISLQVFGESSPSSKASTVPRWSKRRGMCTLPMSMEHWLYPVLYPGHPKGIFSRDYGLVWSSPPNVWVWTGPFQFYCFDFVPLQQLCEVRPVSKGVSRLGAEVLAPTTRFFPWVLSVQIFENVCLTKTIGIGMFWTVFQAF